MNILNSYIGRHIISATLIITAALLGMLIFISLVHELQYVGNGDYSVWQALLYIPLKLPNDLYEIFPMVGLIGSLFGLGLLASHSELIVMRTAGMSILQITWAVTRAILLLVIIVSVIGETAAPYIAQYAEARKATKISQGQALSTLHGIWLRSGNQFIHINEVMPNDDLHEVTQYQFNDSGELEVASFAQRAVPVEDQWQLHEVKQSYISDERITVQQHSTLPWNVEMSRDVLNLAKIEMQALSLVKIYRYIQYLRSNGLDAQQFEFSFWQRLFQPLATAVMMLLAIPFIFGPLSSVTMGLRILSGLSVGFAFYLLNELLGPVSLVYQVPPMLAALLPILLFTIIGFWLIQRVR